MPPKKKANKKGNDDWEAELGETVDPVAAATQEVTEADPAQYVEEDGSAIGGGGLLAALKKNKSKKQKKGKPVDEDYVESEDAHGVNGTNGYSEVNGVEDLAAKAPEEANTDDLFAAPTSKGKAAKGKPGKVEPTPKEDGEALEEDGGTLKSKKEKEKEKKEREKQRKKEQVCQTQAYHFPIRVGLIRFRMVQRRPKRLQRKKQRHLYQRQLPRQNQSSLLRKPKPNLLQPLALTKVARRNYPVLLQL